MYIYVEIFGGEWPAPFGVYMIDLDQYPPITVANT